MPITPALSAAKMRRNLGVTTVKLADNSVTLEKIQQVEANKFLGRTTAGTGNPEPVNQFLHMRVPGWTNGGHVTNWASLSAYLDGVARSNQNCTANTATVNYVPCPPVITPAYLFASILHPNGKIYSIQDGSSPNPPSTYISIMDPEALTVTAIPLVAGRGLGLRAGQSGVLAPNGKIYFCDNMPVICFDPSNNSSTTFGYPSITDGYEGGVLAPNGRIYFAPNTATAVLRVDPDTNTATTLGNMLIGGNEGYMGACLAPNGKIYMFPDNSKTNIVVLDPDTETISQITYSYVSQTRGAGCLAPNGKFYMFSGNTSIPHAILDPNNNSITTINVFPNNTATSSFSNFRLAPDGKFYAGYGNSGSVSIGVVFDPNDNSQTTFLPISLGGLLNAYFTRIIVPSGKIVFVPYTASNYIVMTLPFNNPFNINVCTNPFFNKF